MPGELTRFQAGRSGNPAGRPKDHGVVAAVRKRYGQTGARLIEALHVLAFEGPDARHNFFGESVKDPPAARGESQPLTVNIIGISRPPKLANAHRALPAVDVPTEDSATGREVTDKPLVRNPCETHRA